MLERYRPNNIPLNSEDSFRKSPESIFTRPTIFLVKNSKEINNQLLESFSLHPEDPVSQFLGELLIAYPKALNLQSPPSTHSGSSALYYLDGEKMQGDRFYLSTLRPDSKTSNHIHRFPVIERYRLLAGAAYVNGELLNTKGHFDIKPKTPHRLTTGNSPALILIQMINGAHIPTEELHEYVD